MIPMHNMYTLKTARVNRVKLRFFDSLACPNHAHLVRSFNVPMRRINRFGKDRVLQSYGLENSTLSPFNEDLSFAFDTNPPLQSKRLSKDIPLSQSTLPASTLLQEAHRMHHKTIILLHGFPELWISWKNQLQMLTQTGYRVIAVDLRGFGGSECPEDSTEYDVFSVANDVLHLLRDMNVDRVSIIAHGIGSEVAHFIALYAPKYVECLVSINYLYPMPSRAKTFAAREQEAGSTFDFILSHVESSIEIEYERRMETLFRRLFSYAGVSCASPKVLSPQRSAGQSIIDRLGEPYSIPYYFTSADMDYFLENYQRTGFSGAVNHIRNKDVNIKKFTSLRSHVVQQPALILLGEDDILFDTHSDRHSTEGYRNSELHLISNGGPFLQLQKKDEVNAYVMKFLKTHVSPISKIE